MKSPIKWVGGKKNLVPTLLPHIPKHDGYIEVFGGAGWLLFGKPLDSKWEVLNDKDKNLANFWKVLKDTPEDFIKSFDFEIISRTRFNEYKEQYKFHTYKNSVEQAHILYYLLKAGTGASLPDGGGCGFGRSKTCKSRLVLDKIPGDILDAHERLKSVTIECKDYKDILTFYDTDTSFFFLDPPYRGSSRGDYASGAFTDSDYQELFTKCFNLKGKFLLTLNDDSYIFNLFNVEGFYIYPISSFYSTSKSSKGRKQGCQLIITNYPLSLPTK